MTGSFTSTNPNYANGTADGTLKIDKFAAVIVWAAPTAITYGTPLSGTQLNATSVTPGSFAYSPAAGTVLTAGSQTLSVTFTPTNSANYAPATKTVTLTVNQALSTISWATPAPITFGTALSSTQLNATASVPGTFTYSPQAGTIPPAGNNTLSVQFTPTDSVDYLTATASVTLVVNNPVPIITSMTPALASMGGAAFTLTLNGQGFTANSTVDWANTALATQYVSAAQLTAQVPASAIAAPGIYAVTVKTAAPGGGTSNAIQFEVDSAASGTVTPPTFTTLTATVTAGSSATYAVTPPSAATDASVTCLNLPSGATCSYSAASGAVTITTSTTTPAGTYQITVVFTETLSGAAGAFVLLPFLLLPLVVAKRKLAAQRIWVISSLGFVLMIVAATSVGCGGGGSGSKPSSGTHQVTSSGVVTLTIH